MAPTTAAEDRSGGFLEAGRGDWAGMKVHTGRAWVFSHLPVLGRHPPDSASVTPVKLDLELIVTAPGVGTR
jgi:hypothetical protein